MSALSSERPPVFPFTAVVGQAPLKTALLLAVIEPRLGGVLLSGPRGIAKTTLARALSALLPRGDDAFVELPLGCSTAQLTGSLDIDSALSRQEVRFRPGLLAKAHRGILYVDEVNLLPDVLVDQLLDAAASGRHRVERDGISHVHPASFILIGSMNPEEGELRPQLSDRFGLAIQLSDIPSCEERVAIVRARRQFDADPEGFCQQHEEAMQALSQRLEQARQRLPYVHLPEQIEYAIAERCANAGIEGVRADVAWQRAALAHAALQQQEAVTEDDLATVEALVLNHRQTAPHEPRASSASSSASAPTFMPPSPFSGSTTGPAPASGTAQESFPSSPNAPTSDSASAPIGDSGDIPPPLPTSAIAQPSPSLSSDHQLLKRPEPPSSKASATEMPAIAQGRTWLSASTHGRCCGQDQHTADDIDWERSLSLAENLTPQGLKKVLRRTLHPSAHDAVLILLDSSASQRQPGAFHQTRQVVQQLIAQAQQEQRYVALLYFQGNSVKWLLRGKEKIRNVTRTLESLQPGGGTPLSLALQEGRRWIARWRRNFPAAHIDSWLITDARCQWNSADPWSSPLTVVDSEVGEQRLGRSHLLATQLGGEHVAAAALHTYAAG
ncbi:ATP-binding protein [Zymobacter sp. IVIA_5232.4 C2]|uniref:ATP-binding protein n=1 Tax=Zymobacter sp. IVIA_5232.4 C2 TaxID=3394855 RepID=UPI0039C42EDD